MEREIRHLESDINRAPAGMFVCCHQGNSVKWYITKNGKKKYLPKKYKKTAHRMAEKRYKESLLDDKRDELRVLRSFVSQKTSNHRALDLLSIPGYHALLPEYVLNTSDKLAKWASESYDRSTAHSSDLTHTTFKGDYVRSKSEQTIANLLLKSNIPYRYEDKLTIDGITFHPDFTTRHPKTGQYIYWEHLGLMDTANYRDSAIRKLRIYSDAGIIPMINLIITSETKSALLDPGLVEDLIEAFYS